MGGAKSTKSLPQRVVIESVDDDRSPSFQHAFRLYARIFPPDERVDRHYFRQLLEEKRLGVLFPFDYHFLVARRGRRVLGLATGSYLAVTNMGFVGYLAVDPAAKGLALGKRLRERLVEEMRRDARAAGFRDLDAVLGEVEPDNPWLAHLVRRRGALPLDTPYYQPALRRGRRPVPLVLYVEPVGRPLRRLRVEQVRALLYAIYRRVYRVRFPLRQAPFRRMLQGLASRRWVGHRK